MPFNYEEYNHAGVIALDRDLTDGASAELRRQLDAALETGRVTDFVVDLTSARRLDSHGLEALLWAGRRCGEHQGRLKLAGLDANCLKILEITRLDHRFEWHEDVPAALRALR